MGLLWVYYSLGGPQAKLFFSSFRINGGSSYSLNVEGDRFQVMVLELFLQEAKFLLDPVLSWPQEEQAVLQAPGSPLVQAQGRLSLSSELQDPLDVKSVSSLSLHPSCCKPRPSQLLCFYLPTGKAFLLEV